MPAIPSMASAGKAYDAAGADELCFLDITASSRGDPVEAAKAYDAARTALFDVLSMPARPKPASCR
jgi:imidazole glycerol phosphate synthase subunit HisF